MSISIGLLSCNRVYLGVVPVRFHLSPFTSRLASRDGDVSPARKAGFSATPLVGYHDAARTRSSSPGRSVDSQPGFDNPGCWRIALPYGAKRWSVEQRFNFSNIGYSFVNNISVIFHLYNRIYIKYNANDCNYIKKSDNVLCFEVIYTKFAFHLSWK